jgi:peptidoglycan/xylan/chitin deacetylase (PgdA/CDA1 family)
MPPLVRASIGVHALALGAAALTSEAWPWAAGAVALNHALLTTAGLLPRCDWLGPNMRRLGPASAARGEIAVTLDDGPDAEVTPCTLDLLDEFGARATFFCIAQRAARHSALLHEIIARGHSVQNHTFRHRHDFAFLGPGAIRRELRRAQSVIADLTGHVPTCYRAPAGLRNPFLDPVLHELGMTLVSWTRRGFDAGDRNAERVARRLTRGLAAGDILLLHDGRPARDAAGRPVSPVALRVLLEAARDRGLSSVTLAEAMRP